ncbi:MAG: TolC family protein, partial [Bacteroidales bacterium]|nr:TolC family protein [Bacteroidales bacterium]
MRTKIQTVLMISLVSLVSVGQEAYNLDKCIKTGLENNYSIIVARNRETISDNNYS